MRGGHGGSRRAVPEARAGHAMAYDALRQRVVLYGGSREDMTLLDTWEWDGSNWGLIAAAGQPGASGEMAFDADLGRVVLFGGTEEQPSDQLWQFDGAQWSELPVVGVGPSPRFGSAFAYSATMGLIVSDGSERRMGSIVHESFSFRGSMWRRLNADVEPSRRLRSAMAWRSAERRVWLYGGASQPPVLDPLYDHWAYSETGWSRTLVAGGLSHDGTQQLDMVEHPVTRQMLAAVTEGGRLRTWQFGSRGWVELMTPTVPSALQAPALVADRRRGTVLMVGAADEQVWEFDGADWSRLATAGSPQARRGAVLAYDEQRGVTVLFGGTAIADGERLTDTWELDGNAWREVPASIPSAGQGAMVFHPVRGRITLIRTAGDEQSIWEFDGVTWSELQVPMRPNPRVSPALAADRERDVLVLAAGDPNNEAWEFAFRSDVPIERCRVMPGRAPIDADGDGLAGCSDPDCEGKLCGLGHECREGACVCAGGESETQCSDGLDDDCDGRVDCDDSDCQELPLCSAETACDDDNDNDGDGYADCDDPGCNGIGLCEYFEQSCADGIDQDGDGLTDCEDLDCFLVACARLE